MDELISIKQTVAEAEKLYSSGRFSLAMEHYRNVLFKRLSQIAGRDSDWWAIDAILIERLADLAILEGSLLAAQNLLIGLRDLYSREGNYFARDYIIIKLAHLALESDDISGAHAHLHKLSDVIGDLESIDLSTQGLHNWEKRLDWSGQDAESQQALLTRLYLVMGGILASYGQFHDAVHCLERAETLACTSEIPSISQVCTPLRMSLATTSLALGNFSTCRDWLSRANSTQQQAPPVMQIRKLELLGKLALLEGRFGEALDAFENVLKYSEQVGFTHPMAIASLNIAHLLIQLNKTQEALEHIEYTESLLTSDVSLIVRTQVLRTLAHSRRESLAEQIAIAPSVSEMWSGSLHSSLSPGDTQITSTDPLELPPSSDYLSFFEDRALAVQWRLSKGRFSEAAELMVTLQATFILCDSPLIHARLNVLKGMVSFYNGAYSEAASLLLNSIESLRTLGLLPELWQSKRILSWCYSKMDKSPEIIAELDAEIQEDLEKLTLTLKHSDRSSYLINKWTTTEEYFLGEINGLVTLTHLAKKQSWWRRAITRFSIMRRLNELIGQLDKKKYDAASSFLALEDSGKRAIIPGKTPKLWQRLLFHPRRTATLHFLVLPDRVLLVQHSWLRLGFGVSAISRGDLRDLVSTWYQSTEKFDMRCDLDDSGQNQIKRKLDHIRGKTLDHLGDALQLRALLDVLPPRIKSLRIVPDDSLLGFPFAVLKYRGALLPENFSLCLLSSSTVRVTSAHQQVKNSLLVGVSQGSDIVPPLPNVNSELDSVQPWLQKRSENVQRLMDAEANKSNVMAALEETNLLHIACHGVFRTDKPGESGFVLVPDPKHIQILNLIDLSHLDLSSIEHATLSSCWAADRFILPGRQILGLPEVFLHCGVRSILACLWPVDDFVISYFTKRFYEYVESYPRDEALRRTQLDCIHNRLLDTQEYNLDTSSPIYWAGFNLYGSADVL